MRVLTIGRCAVALGIALAVGPVICPVMAEAAAPEFRHEAATTQAAGLGSVVGGVVEARVRVPPGILAGVPSGGDPWSDFTAIMWQPQVAAQCGALVALHRRLPF